MILDSKEEVHQRKAGMIAGKALKFAGKMIKPGVKLLDVSEAAEQKVMDLGGSPGFPAQTSRNEIAAHYCPKFNDDAVYKEGDCVKLDVGVEVEGFIGDTALSVDLGGWKELVQASRDALNAAIKEVRPGVVTSQIGRKIEEAIQSHGFEPVRNLSGHGLGNYDVHTKPSIPNYDTKSKIELEENQAIAIEPFATTGGGKIHESGDAEVFMQTGMHRSRSVTTRRVLGKINSFNGLPFAKRWLVGIFGEGRVNLAFQEMLREGSLRGFPPLPEVGGGIVSQAEHSLIVKDRPVVTTKVDEE
ncbi:type II methionyl aminopeptidase [Candidatus Woesearchaeota archaeon]|nr:type II methionyl aminopeptidase [Candidatus Woesearchaeota archaeon]